MERMGTIPPNSIGGGPTGTPERKSPSGPIGDFALGKLNQEQKSSLEQMTGQLVIMNRLHTYDSIVFQNLNVFLGGLENQSPPLKEKLQTKVKEAKNLCEQVLENPDKWEQAIPPLQKLLHGLL
jgi:hypothetical protein